MGRGNYVPKSETWERVRFCYVDKTVSAEEVEENSDASEWAWNDFIDEIKRGLAGRAVCFVTEDHWCGGMYGDPMKLLCDNCYYDVAVRDEDCYYIVAVGVTSPIGHSSGRHAFNAIARGLMKAGYVLSLRTGTHTSRRITEANL